ncbi:MAG: hypothetical protein O3C40_02015 [Planctomycetota bacterium]|nr:hypothetical protein [Planctomycetota bacterium]
MTHEPRGHKRLVVQILVLALLFELLTVFLRFGLQLESTRDTASTIGLLTFGIRIHHGYCGALLILVAWGISREAPKLSQYGYTLGWALLLSDTIHHFLVLWPLTGSPQFDLIYPP